MKEVSVRDPYSVISPRKQPVSPEWQNDCKRNASGIMAASFTAGFAWIVASHTFIVLNNGRLIHPSSFGWPLYTCIFVFIIGIYTYLSSEHEQLPFPGRKYLPVDHSTKASLWYESLSVKWSAPYGEGSDRTAASLGPVFSNANSSVTLLINIEKLSVSIEGISPASDEADITFTLPPGRSRDSQSGRIDQIPAGAESGEMYYSVTYGPITGYPRYRQTHKLSFDFSRPITTEAIARNGLKDISVNTSDIEVPTDIEISLSFPDLSHPSESQRSV